MKKISVICAVVSAISLFPSVSEAQKTLFFKDTFDGGSIVDDSLWKIPTWVSPSDGTYLGRTQLRVSQNSQLPSIKKGNAKILLETYNPTGSSFYGTDLISLQKINLNKGVNIKVRAKFDGPNYDGIVGGIFLYSLKPGSNTLHDEIDFELLGNTPNQVQTNIYANEPLGAGHPEFTPYATGTTHDYHTYEIKWLPNKVSWLVDGIPVRQETVSIPEGPMYMHLNMWAPASDWANAYSSSIQPVNSASLNTKYSMSVDSVVIKKLQ